jgi:hypothetical protein
MAPQPRQLVLVWHEPNEPRDNNRLLENAATPATPPPNDTVLVYSKPWLFLRFTWTN